MKKVYFILLIVILLLSGCGNNAKKYTDIQDVNYAKLISSRNKYIGDASSDMKILNYLPGREFLSGIEIKNKRLIVNYGIEKNTKLTEDDLHSFWSEDRIKRIFMYNSSMLLSLIDNVNSVTLRLNMDPKLSLDIDKSGISSFYKETFDEKDLNKFNKCLLDQIGSEKKIEEFYSDNKINIYAF
ncbi:MAG: DUF4825 domain-containing protein [Clostridiaceae bacterium]